MATPGFAIPNILANFSLAPAQVAGQVTKRKQNCRQNTSRLSKSAKMLKKVQSIANLKKNSKEESKLRGAKSHTDLSKYQLMKPKNFSFNRGQRGLKSPWPSKKIIIAATRDADRTHQSQTISGDYQRDVASDPDTPTPPISSQFLLQSTTDPVFSTSTHENRLPKLRCQVRRIDAERLTQKSTPEILSPLRGDNSGIISVTSSNERSSVNATLVDPSGISKRPLYSSENGRLQRPGTVLDALAQQNPSTARERGGSIMPFPGVSKDIFWNGEIIDYQQENRYRKKSSLEKERSGSFSDFITAGPSSKAEATTTIRSERLQHQPSKPKLDLVWKTHGASDPDLSTRKRSVSSSQAWSIRSVADTTSWITASASNESLLHTPPIPERNAQRALKHKRAGIINEVQFQYNSPPLTKPRSVSVASSLYSTGSRGTSFLLGSNFHYDEAGPQRPDSDTLPAIGVALSLLSDRPLFGSATESQSCEQVATSEHPNSVLSRPGNSLGSRPREHGYECSLKLDSGSSNFDFTLMPLPLFSNSKPKPATSQQSTRCKNSGKSESRTSRKSTETKRVDSGVTSTSSAPSTPNTALFTTCSAGNPEWIPALSPFDAHVYLIVGERSRPREGVLRLRLPCQVLIANSEYMKSAIDMKIPTEQQKPIPLPSVTPRIFEIWLRWIYFRSTLGRSPRAVDPTIEDLLKAWRFGMRIGDPTFQDACTDHIVKLARLRYEPPFGLVKEVYNISMPESGLRRLFFAMMCEEKLPFEWRRDEKIAIEEVGQLAWAAYKNERKSNGKFWDKIRGEKEEGNSWRAGGCQFHEHDVFKSASCAFRMGKSRFDFS